MFVEQPLTLPESAINAKFNEFIEYLTYHYLCFLFVGPLYLAMADYTLTQGTYMSYRQNIITQFCEILELIFSLKVWEISHLIWPLCVKPVIGQGTNSILAHLSTLDKVVHQASLPLLSSFGRKKTTNMYGTPCLCFQCRVQWTHNFF